MEPVTAVFKCSFDALYEGCDQLALNVLEEIVKMGAFKPKYTTMAVNGFIADVQAARLMEDDEQRAAKHELLRIELTHLVDDEGEVKDLLSNLKLYIRDAYEDEEVRRVNLAAAGFNDFERAMNYNWEVLRTVMQKANTFVADNSAALLANDNMPAGFPALLAGKQVLVDARVPAFLNSRENSAQGTQAKILASNNIYKVAMDICGDGQNVFRRDPAKHKQFVWDAIQEIVTPAGKAGLSFDVKEDGTNAPIDDVIVTIQREGDEPLSIGTGPDGKGKFTNLKEGTYIGNLVCPGYVTLNVEVKITTGVTSFKHWLMVKNV